MSKALSVLLHVRYNITDAKGKKVKKIISTSCQVAKLHKSTKKQKVLKINPRQTDVAQTPLLAELLKKLNNVKRIESGEEVPEQQPQQAEVESRLPVVLHLNLDLNLKKSVNAKVDHKMDTKKKVPHGIFF